MYELLVHSRQRQIVHAHICSETWYPIKFKLKQQHPNPQSQEIKTLDRETKGEQEPQNTPLADRLGIVGDTRAPAIFLLPEERANSPAGFSLSDLLA